MTNRTANHDSKSDQRIGQDTGLLSNGDFALLGIHDFAYVRQVPNTEEDSDDGLAIDYNKIFSGGGDCDGQSD